MKFETILGLVIGIIITFVVTTLIYDALKENDKPAVRYISATHLEH